MTNEALLAELHRLLAASLAGARDFGDLAVFAATSGCSSSAGREGRRR